MWIKKGAKIISALLYFIFIILALIFAHTKEVICGGYTYYGLNGYPCACGIAANYPDTRIAGGQLTKAFNFPWIALLMASKNIPICGASIISDRYGLTAAHCLFLGYPQKQLRVLVGENNRCDQDMESFLYSISKLLPHPLFQSSTFAYDIMLVKLNTKLTFNFAVQPICLPRWGDGLSSSELEGTVLGWGVQLFHSPFQPCDLMQVNVPVLTREACLNFSKYTPDQVTDTHFCAGYPQGGKDACQGDSGGPLQIRNYKGKYEILGIVSNGISCGLGEYPGIYTNVTELIPWIIVNTIDSNFCS